MVRTGAFADINVIDLDGMRLPTPEYVHDFPGGAGRYIQRSSGYDATIVNGAVFMRARRAHRRPRRTHGALDR